MFSVEEAFLTRTVGGAGKGWIVHFCVSPRILGYPATCFRCKNCEDHPEGPGVTGTEMGAWLWADPEVRSFSGSERGTVGGGRAGGDHLRVLEREQP